MTQEQWLPVPEFEDLYLVSSWGRIKNLTSGKIMLGEDHKGYRRVNLFKNKKRYHKAVHRLVAAAFLSNPENKPEVNHINGDKTDNHITNLEYVTHEENALHNSIMRQQEENSLFPEFSENLETKLINKGWIK